MLDENERAGGYVSDASPKAKRRPSIITIFTLDNYSIIYPQGNDTSDMLSQKEWKSERKIKEERITVIIILVEQQ